MAPSARPSPARSRDRGAPSSSGWSRSPSWRSSSRSRSGRGAASASAGRRATTSIAAQPARGVRREPGSPSASSPWSPGWMPPLAIANAGDGSGRLFVAEQGGAVRIMRDGRARDRAVPRHRRPRSRAAASAASSALPSTPTSRPIRASSSTTPTGMATPRSRRSPSTRPIRIGSTRPPRPVLIHVQQPFANHNGGALAFDAEWHAADRAGRRRQRRRPAAATASQSTTLLGKILRIDVDAGADAAADGPTGSRPTTRSRAAPAAAPEIWLTGLRNPWRMSFDRATGDLWIGDVGQNAWEEVDVQRAGHARRHELRLEPDGGDPLLRRPSRAARTRAHAAGQPTTATTSAAR